MEKQELIQICKEALIFSSYVLRKVDRESSAEVIEKKDIVTKADLVISDSLIEFFKSKNIPAILYDEEHPPIKLMDNPEFLIGVDPLDGTMNYFRAKGILPYTAVVTIYDSLEPKFEDAVVAGVFEHNSRRMWHAVRGEGCFLDGKRVYTSGKKSLDKKTFVAVDCGPENQYQQNYNSVIGFRRNFGVAGLHLALVSSGSIKNSGIDAYTCPIQKSHELGAGYLLIKEANGYILDATTGNPIDKTKYDFNGAQNIIAAATKELAEELRKNIKKN